MRSQYPTITFCQHLKVAARLCGFHYAEGIFLPRNRQVSYIFTGDLQKDTGVRAALISLSRGMQKTWAKPEACSYTFRITNVMPQRLQDFLVRALHLDVSQHAKIITRLDSA